WVYLYKVGAIRSITLQKYYVTEQKIQELVPELKIKDLDRYTYQQLLNNYALTHEKQTTMDFHHHLKGAILDAVDEGVLNQNPTRKIVIKGKNPRPKKAKFLNQFEVQVLLKELNLKEDINWDWFILLIIKTGLRFSEALALTPSDFDFSTQKISINKTWDYKMVTGSFQPTKNESSNRKIQIDWQLAMQFSQLIKMKDSDKPIFVKSRVFNSTINNRLKVLCQNANIPTITIHSLRHTHASLLLFAGVSIASVANRLGHSSMTTTQETYLHIIQELENQDNDKIIRHLSMLM
ncbi:site-specific integrase, partial [Listeria monocytogenes]|nr:site-specific integrase [Listeria monocytogenes]